MNKSRITSCKYKQSRWRFLKRYSSKNNSWGQCYQFKNDTFSVIITSIFFNAKIIPNAFFLNASFLTYTFPNQHYNQNFFTLLSLTYVISRPPLITSGTTPYLISGTFIQPASDKLEFSFFGIWRTQFDARTQLGGAAAPSSTFTRAESSKIVL